MKSIIRLSGIGKIYHGKKTSTEALRDISLEAAPKEVLGIMGPSGCGKTALLKMIAGIEPCTSGNLTLFGTDCTGHTPQNIKRKMGFIYQDSNLLPWRSVEANLRFPLEIFGLQKQEEYTSQIAKALEIVGLSDYRKALPQELSGGMMQRVSIARSLVFNPEVLLMDQPFGALDAITRKKLRFDFMKIFEQSQKTIVIVTNSIDEALMFSNRIYIVSEAPGTIQEVVDVDIPHQDRPEDITTDARFNALRAKMIGIIKKQYATEKVLMEQEEGMI